MINEPIIVLENYIKNHTLESMCGVMHELANKTNSYDDYLYNIKYYLVVGQNISVLDILPLFIWETYKNTNWEDVYLYVNDSSNEYKEWLKRYNRKQKIKNILDNE